MVPERMRRFAWLALLVVVSCKKESPPAKVVEEPRGGGGSAEPEPKWVKDPPAVLRDKINAVNAHAIVLKRTAEFPEYRDVLGVVERTPGVVAAAPFIFAELQIAKAGGAPVGIAIKGVDPERAGRVLGVARHLKAGTLDSLAGAGTPPIVLGDDLARTLGVRLGDEVTVSQPDVVTPAQRLDPPAKTPGTFRVSALFHLDFDEYDERLALVPLAALQAMLARGDQVMGIEMIVNDLDRSDELAKSLEAKLGEPYVVQDWYELNKQLFTALFGQRRP